MARVAFLKDGMELNAENISGSYSMGDALPVDLVEKAQEAWKNRMGYDDKAHVAAGRAWDQVRVGAQTFSSKQFLEAQKNFVPGQTSTNTTKTPERAPHKIIKAFEGDVPDWGIAEQITPTFQDAKARIESPRPHQAGPVINGRGEVDYQATRDREMAEALKKIGATPRAPKNDTF